MATILSEAKSTGKDPYAYYTVNATASDRTVSTVKVKVDVTSRLSSSQSFLGKGSTMGLIGYIKLNDEEHSITLKTTNQSWSGTTEHTASATFTVEDLEGSQSQLTDIKFRVSRTGSAADNYSQGAAMSSKNCSNLQIGVGHTEPTNVTYVMTEKNQKLINAGISNDLIVENLSIKEFLFSYTLHDGASFKRCRIWNMASAVYGSDENPFSINLKNQPFPGKYEGKILLLGDVVDSLDGYGASPKTYYDYIPYTNISLVETSTTARRNGQTSGKVYLNINGTFYNGSVGNVTQTKPTIKYKFWKLGDNEPTTYNNTIPSDNISILNNTFSVSNFEIGSSVETATNYFNPELAYRVKIYVEDNFTSYTSQDKSIPIGEATWTEYKDRVDFKKITIKNKNEFFYEPGETFECDYDTILNGYVTSSTKNVRLAFPVPKRLDNINSITIESLNAEARCGKGYLNNQSGNVEYVGKSGYTIGAHKSNNNVVNILIIKDSAWTNVDNNTPVVFVADAGGIKLTFNG